jgi:hypothetical protein
MSAKSSTQSSMCFRPVANGRLCRKICRRRERRISIFSCGIGTARWSVSTRRSMSRSARRLDAKRPECRDHRLPERQGGAKGGSSLAPQGFDAGKKVTGRKRHILVDISCSADGDLEMSRKRRKPEKIVAKLRRLGCRRLSVWPRHPQQDRSAGTLQQRVGRSCRPLLRIASWSNAMWRA